MANGLEAIYRLWRKAAPMLTLPPIKVKRPTKYRWLARSANWSKPTSTSMKPTTRLPEHLPAVHTLVQDIQPFKCGDPWLVDLCGLTNDAKHNNLSKTENKKS